MTEEDLKQTIENLLQIQTNNEYNFQLLQAQVDDLRKQISDLSEIRTALKMPPPENYDREPFEFAKEWWSSSCYNLYHMVMLQVTSLS